MKNTPLDKTKADKRAKAVQALKDRGPSANEKSVANLRERVALIEEMLGLG